MKNIFIAITLIYSLTATAQKSESISDSSKAKNDIYSKTLLWIAKTWGDPDKVISSKDDVSGKILVKGGLKAVPKSDGGFSVKGMTLTELTITVSNGSAKLDFAHTTFQWDAGTVWNFADDDGGTQKEKWKAAVLDEMTAMIASYKANFKGSQ